MAAETLVRGAQRVEPLEHLFALVGRNPEAIVADREFDAVVAAGDLDRDPPAGRGERDRVVEQVLDNPFQPRGIARHDAPGAVGRDQFDGRRGGAAAPVARRDHRRGHRRQIDRDEGGAAKLGVDPAGIGDFGDEPVDPLDIVRGNRAELLAQRRVLDLFERFERAAQAGERVFDLVRHVRGKAFHCVDPLAQRRGHVRHRAREQPDLVAALGQAGDDHRAFASQPHADRGADQCAQRAHDRPCQKQRQLDREDQRGRQDYRQRLARVAHALGDVAGVARGQQHRLARQNRRGRGNHRSAVGGVAFEHHGPPGGARGGDLRPGGSSLYRRVAVRRDRRGTERKVHDPVEQPRGILQCGIACGIDEGERRRGQRETVGKHCAARVKYPQPQFLVLADAHQQSVALAWARRDQRVGGDLGFGAGKIETFGQQLLAVAVEVEQAPRHQRQRDNVDRQNARGERDAPRPEQALTRSADILSFRQMRILRRTAYRSRRTRCPPRGTCGAGV